MEVKRYTFDELSIGMSASFSVSWSKDDIESFAKLSGDYNPLHLDEIYAATTPFKKIVVHGMLVASSLSQLVGMHLPGEACLIISESVSFKEPVYCDEKLVVSGVVTQKSEATKVVVIHVTIQKEDIVKAEGDITLLVRS